VFDIQAALDQALQRACKHEMAAAETALADRQREIAAAQERLDRQGATLKETETATRDEQQRTSVAHKAHASTLDEREANVKAREEAAAKLETDLAAQSRTRCPGQKV
jgi:hypothetical protein